MKAAEYRSQAFHTRRQRLLETPRLLPGVEIGPIVAKYNWPEVSPATEMDSFRWHMEHVANPDPQYVPSSQIRMKAREYAGLAYQRAAWEIPEKWDSDERIIYIISNKINMTGSPGVGFPGLSTNDDVLKSYGMERVVAGVRSRLDHIYQITAAMQRFRNVVRLFIKQEPTKVSKLIEGRPRLIWSFNLYDQIVSQLVMLPSLEAEIKHWKVIPTKVGLSTVGSSWDDFIRYLEFGAVRNEQWLEMDKTGWDFSVPGWLLREEQACRWELRNGRAETKNDNEFKTVFDAVYDGLCQSDVGFSDGTVVQQTTDFAMKSGHVLTISSNSRMQCLLKITASLDLWGRYDGEVIAAMGDDTLEESFDPPGVVVRDTEYRKWLRNWFIVKDDDFVHAKHPQLLQFCSNRTVLVNGLYTPVLQNWEKTCYSLLFEDFKGDAIGSALMSLQMDYVHDRDKFNTLTEAMKLYAPHCIRPWSVVKNLKLGLQTSGFVRDTGQMTKPSGKPVSNSKLKKQFNKLQQELKEVKKHQAVKNKNIDAVNAQKLAQMKAANTKQKAQRMAAQYAIQTAQKQMLKQKQKWPKPHKPNLGLNLKSSTVPLSGGSDVTTAGMPVSVATTVVKAQTQSWRGTRREEVSDVTIFMGENAFSPFIINPGNEELFPWLSRLARNFASYKFHKLWLEYVPSASTGVGGTVAIAVNPNADDAPYEDPVQVLNRDGSVSGTPYTPLTANAIFKSTRNIATKFITDVTAAKNLGSFFDDLHTVADGIGMVFTGLGNIFSASSLDVEIDGIPVTVSVNETMIGKLYVNYDVELIDPVLEENEDDGTSENQFKSVGQPFGDNDTWTENVLNLTMDAGVTKDWTQSFGLQFPEPGRYMITVYGTAGTGAAIDLDVDWFTFTMNTSGGSWVEAKEDNRVVDATATSNFNDAGQNRIVVAWCYFEVQDPNAQQISFSFTGANIPWVGSKLYVSRVTDEIGAVKQIGLNSKTRSCLNMPKNKGLLEIHKEIKQKKGAEAANEVRGQLSVIRQRLAENPPTDRHKPIAISSEKKQWRDIKVDKESEKSIEVRQPPASERPKPFSLTVVKKAPKESPPPPPNSPEKDYFVVTESGGGSSKPAVTTAAAAGGTKSGNGKATPVGK